MKQSYPLRVGLVAFGLEAYWSQFQGLRERLEGYLQEVAANIAGPHREIINLGLVDSHDASIEASHHCRRQDIDLLLLYPATYALSSTVLPIVRRARVPLLLLNVQPEPAIDFALLEQLPNRTAMTGEWLAFCSACTVPEISNVLRRQSIAFQQVTGSLHGDPLFWQELQRWLQAAEVAHTLAHSRLGLMGHYYSGMLDIATDLATVSGTFGVHLEQIELDELTALRNAVDPDTLNSKLSAFEDFFTFDPDCLPSEKHRAATTAAALDTLVAQHKLDMLAYYARGSGNPANEDTMSSIILGTSMLTAAGISVAGEYEIKNVLAMKILSLLGAGGSFSEFYAVDFAQDVILFGHDGPGHAAIAESKIRVRPLAVYHGKVGAGLSVEMNVRYGPVTLLSVVEDKLSGFKLLVAQAESVPGPILKIGNTNSRYRFPVGARTFLEHWNSHGPAHHCAIGIGHHAEALHKLATLLDIHYIQVC